MAHKYSKIEAIRGYLWFDTVSHIGWKISNSCRIHHSECNLKDPDLSLNSGKFQ